MSQRQEEAEQLKEKQDGDKTAAEQFNQQEKAAKQKALVMEKQRLKQMEDEKLCSLASCTKPGNQRCTKCKTVSYCSKN